MFVFTFFSVQIIKPFYIFSSFGDSHYFLLLCFSIRTKPDLKKVFLSENQPSEKVKTILGKFPKIIFIQGSPFKDKALFRAKIQVASKAVIFGTSQSPGKSRNTDEDTESLFIYKAIKKCNPQLQIIIEMMNPKNLQFLQTEKENMDKTHSPGNDNFR